MPLWLLRFWRPLLALAVMAGGWLWFQRELSIADRQGYSRAQAEDKAAADLQQERNRDLQRQAEKRYVVQAGIREKFVVQTVREIRHDTENLAACVLSPAAADRLRHAAECVSGEDRPASCGAGEQVR